MADLQLDDWWGLFLVAEGKPTIHVHVKYNMLKIHNIFF